MEWGGRAGRFHRLASGTEHWESVLSGGLDRNPLPRALHSCLWENKLGQWQNRENACSCPRQLCILSQRQ